ncbi:unnamed protein product [Lactuca saligna]|uniref:Uncharacterized protein n=1 Tax=Lactuca saligna TaxID=75948 RepID=A0AA35Z6P4_LACSI|nr:unnamed protein product [Lactuca saligna]
MFPNPIIVSNVPPLKFTSEETPNPLSNEEHSNDVMLDKNSTYVGALLILTALKSLQKPSSSKPSYDFDISSFSSKQEEEIKFDANSKVIQGNESETNPRNQSNETETNPAENSSPSKLHDVNDCDNNDNKSESSTSDTNSSDENIVDLLVMLEIRDNMARAISKFDSLHKIVPQLKSKLDSKVSSLDSKHELILKSPVEIKSCLYGT